MGSYTFQAIQTRVSDEIMDSSNASVSLTQVKQAIVSAVEYYERERTWFNETVTRSLVTVANFPAVAVPTDMVFIDKLQYAATSTFTATTLSGTATLTSITDTSTLVVGQFITGTGIPASTLIKSIDSATQITMGDVFGASVNATASASITVRLAAVARYKAEQIPYSDYTAFSATATSGGWPSQFAYYQDRLWLYPAPNAVFALFLTYIQRLTTLSGNSDNNGWTNYAEPLIRSRAKWDIFNNLLHIPDLGKVAKMEEMDTLSMLDAEREQRNTTGYVRASYL